MATAAVVAFAWPTAAALLIYNRAPIAAGQAWRLWTGHLVHYSAGHLLWNLAVFVPAGMWLERVAPKSARWFLALAPLIISGALLMFEPALAHYAGLSGLAAGLLVLLALDRLGAGAREPGWLWGAVLALVMIKIAAEFVTGASLFARFDEDTQTVPLAHLTGAACALTAFFLRHRKFWLR